MSHATELTRDRVRAGALDAHRPAALIPFRLRRVEIAIPHKLFVHAN